MAEPPVSDLHQEDAQTSPLLALPQENIDCIATHLDLKSLVRLQLTCRSLYPKCLDAQRLKEVHFSTISVGLKNDWKSDDFGDNVLLWRLYTEDGLFMKNDSADGLSESQFEATNFLFRADDLNFHIYLNTEIVRKVKDSLSGRGTVKELYVESALESIYYVDHALFGQMLQALSISKLEIERMAAPVWQLPAVKQLTNVWSWGRFTLSLEYLAETAFEECTLNLEEHGERNENSSVEINIVLKKWADGQKEIKDWEFYMFRFREEELFKDFFVVSEGDFQPTGRRPLVVRATIPIGERSYTVERTDGKKLYVVYSYSILKLQDSPVYDPRFLISEDDSESDSGDEWAPNGDWDEADDIVDFLNVVEAFQED